MAPCNLAVHSLLPGFTQAFGINDAGHIVGSSQFLPVPQPSSLVLFSVGLLGLGLAWRRRASTQDHPTTDGRPPEVRMETERVVALKYSRTLFAFALCTSVPAFSTSLTVIVPGTSDPWLAGMPPGSVASVTDVAPSQSPVQAIGLAIVPGTPLKFSASGLVSNGICGPPFCPFFGPDGVPNLMSFRYFTGLALRTVSPTSDHRSMLW